MAQQMGTVFFLRKMCHRHKICSSARRRSSPSWKAYFACMAHTVEAKQQARLRRHGNNERKQFFFFFLHLSSRQSDRNNRNECPMCHYVPLLASVGIIDHLRIAVILIGDGHSMCVTLKRGKKRNQDTGKKKSKKKNGSSPLGKKTHK